MCKYHSLKGIQSHYEFEAIGADVVAMCTYSCWCPKSMLAYGHGVGMSSTLYVAG
jgi:hypothetical protein